MHSRLGCTTPIGTQSALSGSDRGIRCSEGDGHPGARSAAANDPVKIFATAKFVRMAYWFYQLTKNYTYRQLTRKC
jgi:hypothetical protein